MSTEVSAARNEDKGLGKKFQCQSLVHAALVIVGLCTWIISGTESFGIFTRCKFIASSNTLVGNVEVTNCCGISAWSGDPLPILFSYVSYLLLVCLFNSWSELLPCTILCACLVIGCNAKPFQNSTILIGYSLKWFYTAPTLTGNNLVRDHCDVLLPMKRM